jgi:hypothetical protein
MRIAHAQRVGFGIEKNGKEKLAHNKFHTDEMQTISEETSETIFNLQARAS